MGRKNNANKTQDIDRLRSIMMCVNIYMYIYNI